MAENVFGITQSEIGKTVKADHVDKENFVKRHYAKKTMKSNESFSFLSVGKIIPNTEAKIELPDNFELVSGTLTWRGNLEANEEQKIEVVIKSNKVGYYKLSGSAISRQGESYFGKTAIIDIEITPDDAIAGSKPENNWYEPAQGQGLPVAENNQSINGQLLISKNPELNKELMRVSQPAVDL